MSRGAIFVAGVGAVLALQGVFAVLSPAGADAAAKPTCHGHKATIVGTNKNDSIDGTPGNDVIVALGGNDVVRGRGGNDVICGGLGADTINGGAGNDQLYGGFDEYQKRHGGVVTAGDTLEGDGGNDGLHPGPDPRVKVSRLDGPEDVITYADAAHGIHVNLAKRAATGAGHDTLSARGVYKVIGSAHNDVMRGSNHRDYLVGSSGNDRIYGGPGDDQLSGNTPGFHGDHDLVSGGGGDDVINGGGTDRLYGGPGSDRITSGGTKPLHVDGGSGNDWMELPINPATQRTLSGGPGHDIVSFIAGGSDAQGTLNMASGALTVTGQLCNPQTGDCGPTETSTMTATGFEYVRLRTYFTAWTVTGTDGPDRVTATVTQGTSFSGHGGDDIFSGSTYDDTYRGGPGHDVAITMGHGTNTCSSVEHFRHGTCAHGPDY